MQITDAVQNRKDLEIYHLETHENRQVLDQYFKNWLRRPDISDDRYQELVARLLTTCAC